MIYLFHEMTSRAAHLPRPVQLEELQVIWAGRDSRTADSITPTPPLPIAILRLRY